jgi:hypothetical protein
MSQSEKRNHFSNLIGRFVRGLAGAPSTAPSTTTPVLRVTTHIARDLLQNAAYFNSVPKAVTEYVTNAIDNSLPGKTVHCEVTLTREEIKVADNASGMTYTELSNFFQMHGENVQRRRGRAVRGKFGTGKSAAFGIASTFRIDTIKDGQRNVVELRRTEVEAARDGQPIPVQEVTINQSTREHSGTTITIKDLNVKNVDPDAVRAYLEKLLGRHLRQHHVVVNKVACRYREPESVKSFRFKASADTAAQIGPAACTLKISKQPLAREDNVVAVLCNGFLQATTLAGKQSELFVEYIFGEVEVPGLDSDTGAIPPFDNTRNLSLNLQNPKVQVLLTWLSECIEEVRQELIARDKRRRYSREMRLLRRVANKIGNYLAEDFRVVQETLPWATMSGRRRAKNKGRRQHDGKSELAPTEPARTLTLFERTQNWVNTLLGRSAPTGTEAESVELPDGNRRSGRVQFEIDYVRLGKEGPRSRYISNRRTIYLNRDHPQLRAAETEAGLNSLTFEMLSFDIAFTEYALAVVSQLADQGVEVADPIDASEMVQEILDRLGRKAAEYFNARAGLLLTQQTDDTDNELESQDVVHEKQETN